jgi:DNA-binding LacI/PurR family transcriptional regulator
LVEHAQDIFAGPASEHADWPDTSAPEDVRIVGIDDVEYASLFPVPLATVHQPCLEIGAAAMAAMLKRDDKSVWLA